MPEPPRNNELPSEDELNQLPPEAIVAYAARCAMRVQPLVGADSFGELDEGTIISHIEAVDIAITISAVSPRAAARAAAAAARAALDAAAAAAAARATARAADAARAALDAAAARAALDAAAAARAAVDAIAAYAKAPKVATADARAAIEASREDYEFLKQSSDYENNRDAIFARPLWQRGGNNGEVSQKWNKMLDRWEQGLSDLGLDDIAIRHHRLIDGGGIIWGKAQQRITVWVKKQDKESDSHEIKTKTRKVTKKIGEKKKKKKKQQKKEIDDGSGESSQDEISSDTSPYPQDTTGAPSGKGDRTAVVDRLGRKTLVRALTQIITTPHQDTPLTLALLGKWGTGKSSVIELLKQRLPKCSAFIHGGMYKLGGSIKRDDFKYEVMYAEFNAWQYEHEKNVRAALAQEVVNGLTENIGFFREQILKIRFAWVEYRREMVKAFCELGIAFIAVCVGLWITLVLSDSAVTRVFTSTGIIAVGVGIASYLWKHYKPLLDHPSAVKMKKYLNIPDYRKDLGMIPTIKRHLKTLCRLRGVFITRSKAGNITEEGKRRLLVVVDDLDRCHDKHITETLDAIKLVMDIPGVIVLIAIDHRIAFRAMAEHYKELAGEGRSMESIARDYLGKIIQLPVMLPEPESMDDFIDERLFAGVEEEAEKPIDQGIPAGGLEDKKTHTSKTPSEGGPKTSSNKGELDDKTKKKTDDRTTDPEKTHGKDKDVESDTATGDQQFTFKDREQFKTLTEVFIFKNPRQLLRLRNTYRLIVRLNTIAVHNHFLMALLFWHELLSQSTPEMRRKLEEQFKKRLDSKKKAAKTNTEGQYVDKIITAMKEANGGNIEKSAYEEHSQFVILFVLPHGEAAPKSDSDGEGTKKKPVKKTARKKKKKATGSSRSRRVAH